MSEDKKKIKDLELLADEKIENEEASGTASLDEKYIPKSLLKDKPKRILSEAQLENLRKGREKALNYKKNQLEIRKQLENEKKKEIEKQMEEYKKKLEDDFIKKAIRLKKKHIMREKEMNELSDDDTPMEKVKEKLQKVKLPAHESQKTQIIKELPNQQIPQKPKFIFI